MTKWHRISINLTEKDCRTLKFLAGLKGYSTTHFIRDLLTMHINSHKELSGLIEHALTEKVEETKIE